MHTLQKKHNECSSKTTLFANVARAQLPIKCVIPRLFTTNVSEKSAFCLNMHAFHGNKNKTINYKENTIQLRRK